VTYYTLGIVVLIGLVSYRLARLLAHDKIAQPLRDFTYKMACEHGRPGRWLNTLMTCPFCLSVWFAIAGVVWFGWLIAPEWPDWAEMLLAVGAVAGVGSFLSAVDLALTAYVDSHTEPKPGT